jgi:hypothetical protein
MDKNLNKNELELQNLLETKNFDELSDSERVFVMTQMSKNDYVLSRSILLTAPTIFDDEIIPTPVPLIINKSSKATGYYQLPLYQAIMAVAATIAIMLLVLPINKVEQITSVPEYIVKTDTIEIEKEIIMYDTFYQTVEKPIYINRKVLVENSNCVEPIQEAPRLLNSNEGSYLTELTQTTIENKGVSLRNDNVSSLIVEF